MRLTKVIVLALVVAGVSVSSATARNRSTFEPHSDALTLAPTAPLAQLRSQVATARQSTQLWKLDKLNQVADDVTGQSDMVVAFEDDATEWASFIEPGVDPTSVLGFVYLYVPALYHDIFISPLLYPTITAWATSGSPTGIENAFSILAMTVVHESFHWRLMSEDESAVNACALKYLPYYLDKDFGVPAQVTQTTTQQVPQTTTTTVPVTSVRLTTVRVKVRGKWVTKTKRTTVTRQVTKTTTTYVTQTVSTQAANPLFTTIVSDATAFYSQQPPPYNSGVCPV